MVGPGSQSESRSSCSEASVMVKEVRLARFRLAGAAAGTKSVLVLGKHPKRSPSKLHVLERRGDAWDAVLELLSKS